MLQVIKISGFSFETADDEDIDIRKNIRNLLLKSIAGGSFTLTFHTVRRKQPLFNEDDAMPEMPCYFANYMEEQWRKKNLRKETYVNELYLTVMRRQNKQGVGVKIKQICFFFEARRSFYGTLEARAMTKHHDVASNKTPAYLKKQVRLQKIQA